MDHRREARVSFVVAGGDAAELLDLAEEVFDQVTPLVDLEVARDCSDPIGFGRDHGNRASIGQVGADRVAVKSLVGEKSAEIEVCQKRSDTSAVMSLSRQPDEPHEIAQRIDPGDDLSRQAAAGAPDGLILSPPLCAGTVLVHPDDGSIDDHVLEIRIVR